MLRHFVDPCKQTVLSLRPQLQEHWSPSIVLLKDDIPGLILGRYHRCPAKRNASIRLRASFSNVRQDAKPAHECLFPRGRSGILTALRIAEAFPPEKLKSIIENQRWSQNISQINADNIKGYTLTFPKTYTRIALCSYFVPWNRSSVKNPRISQGCSFCSVTKCPGNFL